MKFLLRCGGTLNLPNNESNCKETVAIPAILLPLGLAEMAKEIARIERWSFSERREDGTTTIQPVCPECAARLWPVP